MPLLVILGPVSLTRTGLNFNCKRLQKNWTAVPVHQRCESVAVAVHIFWQNFKNCEKPVWTGFELHTLGTLISLDYSSETHQRSSKIVKKWMRYGQHNLRWLFCLLSTEIWSQSFLHWSESSRGRFDSGEGVEDDRTGFERFQTGLSRSQSELVMNCKLDCKRLVSQFVAVPVQFFFDYLDLFRTGSGPTCLIWKAETGLSWTLKH